MITDSYVASCYIENIDGQYHIECEMTAGDKKVYADYDGENFVDGVNEIMTDVTAQILKEPEPKPEESLEEKVVRLENLVAKLQEENNGLNSTINNLTKKNKECVKESYEDNLNKTVDYFNNLVNDLMSEKDRVKNHWPYIDIRY